MNYKVTHTTTYKYGELSYQELEDLKLTIKANPQLYVGQEKVTISPGPSLVNGKIVPRNTLFRNFLVSNGESYTLMAGGLSRTSAGEGNFVISNQLGGLSKDTWIIGLEPMDRVINILSAPTEAELEYSNTVLPSHTAENLFWVGRYTERVLGNARFLRTVIQYITEGNRLRGKNDINTEHCLLRSLTEYTYTYPGFTEGRKKIEYPWPELKDIIFNQSRPGSLKYNYTLFSKAVFAVREHWSTDAWRLLRGMDEQWQNVQETDNVNLGIIDPLNHLITSMMAFMGLNRESISREQGWLVLDAGRKIEYSLLLVSMIMATLVNRHDEEVEFNLQESFLISNETLVNYRYKYRAHIQLPLVLELMLFDPNNPRSLAYQLERLKINLHGLPDTSKGNNTAEHNKLLMELYRLMEAAHKDHLTATESKQKKYKNLEIFLIQVSELLQRIHEAVSKTYFKHQQKQQQIYIAENS